VKMVAYPLSEPLAEIPEESGLFHAGGKTIERDEQVCGELSQVTLLPTKCKAFCACSLHIIVQRSGRHLQWVACGKDARAALVIRESVLHFYLSGKLRGRRLRRGADSIGFDKSIFCGTRPEFSGDSVNHILLP
jgi:hypothetical protein